MKKYSKIAVINANGGTITNLITLAGGFFNVPGELAVNTTNVGWDDNREIFWEGMIGCTRTAYAAGTYRKIKFDVTGVTIVAGTEYWVRVYQKTKSQWDTAPLTDITIRVTAVTGDDDLTLMTKIYNKFLEAQVGTGLVVTNTPVAGSEYFYVEGKFGTPGIEIHDMGYYTSDSAIFTVTYTTATFAQCHGTPAIVNFYSPNDGLTAQYVTYEYEYYDGYPAAPFGHGKLKKLTAVAFVDIGTAATDAAYLRENNLIFSGLKKSARVTATGASKATACEITKASHGLVTGDVIILEGVTGAADGTNALGSEWEALNGGVYNITRTAATTFTIVEDTSAFVDVWDSLEYRILDPYQKRS